MTVEVTGTASLHARLVALQKVGKPIMGLVGLAAVREQKILVPRKTGNLGRTIHLASATARVAVTEATAKYAAAVEFGTKPHVIRPRNAGALRFPSKGTPTTLGGRVRSGAAKAPGAFAFATIVHHPGTKPKPFMVPGAQRAIARADIAGIVIKAWNEAA